VLAGEHNAQIRGNQRQNRKHFHVCCETISNCGDVASSCTFAAFHIRMILNTFGTSNSNVPHQLLAVDSGCDGRDRVEFQGCGIVSDQACFPERGDDRHGVSDVERVNAQHVVRRFRRRLRQGPRPRSPDPYLPRSRRYQVRPFPPANLVCAPSAEAHYAPLRLGSSAVSSSERQTGRPMSGSSQARSTILQGGLLISWREDRRPGCRTTHTPQSPAA
jgi:hypothetical protein